MNLNNKKIIALLMTIVAFTSILNLEYYSYYDKGVLHDESNINEYYISQEIINMLEQKTKRENQVQAYKYYNKVISNYFNKYIIGNINSTTNICKLKYTAVINDIKCVYNDGVFVVLYIHKKDGKKHSLLLS